PCERRQDRIVGSLRSPLRRVGRSRRVSYRSRRATAMIAPTNSTSTIARTANRMSGCGICHTLRFAAPSRLAQPFGRPQPQPPGPARGARDGTLFVLPMGASIAPPMNRRAFVTGLGAVLAAPVAAEAQETKVWRIGYLTPTRAVVRPTLDAALRER